MAGKLKLADLAKQFAARHPDYPKQRYTKLISKIETGEAFAMLNGKDKILDYASNDIKLKFKRGDLDSLKRNQNLFKEKTTGLTVRLDALEKTDEFGGGGGSGAGAEITALVESAQCLYCALVWYVFKRKMKLDEVVTPTQFKTAYDFCDVTESLESLKQNLTEDWIKSSILGANKLYEKYSTIRDARFHRGSTKVNEIEAIFKAINRKEGAFGDINKWSPADMYIFKNMQDISSIKEEKTLKGLNGEMIKLYLDKKVIGVSLKKCENQAKFSNININESKGTTSGVKFVKYITKANDRATIYDSMDAYLYFGDRSFDRIQWRSFGTGDGLTGFQGEIKGETANQGKVSLGPASFIIKQYSGVILPTSSSIASRVRRKDDTLCKEIYEMAKKLGVNNLPPMADHIIMCYQQPPKWRYAKYLAFKVLTTIDAQSKAKKDKITSDLYYYAGSKSSFAAPYAKIEG